MYTIYNLEIVLIILISIIIYNRALSMN